MPPPPPRSRHVCSKKLRAFLSSLRGFNILFRISPFGVSIPSPSLMFVTGGFGCRVSLAADMMSFDGRPTRCSIRVSSLSDLYCSPQQPVCSKQCTLNSINNLIGLDAQRYFGYVIKEIPTMSQLRSPRQSGTKSPKRALSHSLSQHAPNICPSPPRLVAMAGPLTTAAIRLVSELIGHNWAASSNVRPCHTLRVEESLNNRNTYFWPIVRELPMLSHPSEFVRAAQPFETVLPSRFCCGDMFDIPTQWGAI